FLVRVRVVDAAGTKKKRLAPGAGKSGNVGSVGDDARLKSWKGAEVNGWDREHFVGFGDSRNSLLNRGPSRIAGIDQADENFGYGVVGDDVGGSAAFYCSDVESTLAENRVEGQGYAPHAFHGVEKLFDGGFAEVRIG